MSSIQNFFVVGSTGYLGEINGSGITRVDVHLPMRAFSIRVGPGWDPLESRRSAAARLAMPKVRPVDLTCGFAEPAGATGLLTAKIPRTVGRSACASEAVKPARLVGF
jgi:hypothetical protein